METLIIFFQFQFQYQSSIYQLASFNFGVYIIKANKIPQSANASHIGEMKEKSPKFKYQ